MPVGPVAQWIRHRPTEPGIAGSSPAGVIAAAFEVEQSVDHWPLRVGRGYVRAACRSRIRLHGNASLVGCCGGHSRPRGRGEHMRAMRLRMPHPPRTVALPAPPVPPSRMAPRSPSPRQQVVPPPSAMRVAFLCRPASAEPWCSATAPSIQARHMWDSVKQADALTTGQTNT